MPARFKAQSGMTPAIPFKALGFSFVEALDAATLNARYFAGRKDGLSLRGRGHLMHARV